MLYLITNAQAHKQETSNAQEHNQKTSNAQAHKQETSIKQNYNENVWGWTLDIQSVVFIMQIRYKLLRLLEFQRYNLKTEILSELWMLNNFGRVLALLKLL